MRIDRISSDNCSHAVSVDSNSLVMNKAVSFISSRIKANSNATISLSNDMARRDEECKVNNSVHSRHVRLAHSLDSLLFDPSAISYFIQFFEDSGLLLSDARRIYEKYIEEKSRHNIGLPKRIALSIKDKINEETVDSCIFNEAQAFVYHLFKLRYFDEFKKSIHYKRHESDVLNHTNLDLEDLMYSQDLLPLVMEVIHDDVDRNRMQFILAVHIFEDSSEGTDEDLESDAMAIYEKYISLQARMSIDISHSSRTQIESLICTTDGKPSRKCFDAAKKSSLVALNCKYRDLLNESTALRDYRIDLNSIIDNTVELPSHNRRGRSDSHSCNSSSNGTRVSMPLSNEYLERTWRTSSTSTDVQPTLNTLRSSRLAEMDELGRYRPLYDNSLVSVKKDGRLKEKLRKYVDKKSVREEEVADEVARSIIADVIASTQMH